MKVFRPKEEGPSARTLGWGLPGTRTEGRGWGALGAYPGTKGAGAFFLNWCCPSRRAGLSLTPRSDAQGQRTEA